MSSYCCIKKTPWWDESTKKWLGLSPFQRTLIRCCLFCPFVGPCHTSLSKKHIEEKLAKGEDVETCCPYLWPELFEKEISVHAE